LEQLCIRFWLGTKVHITIHEKLATLATKEPLLTKRTNPVHIIYYCQPEPDVETSSILISVSCTIGISQTSLFLTSDQTAGPKQQQCSLNNCMDSLHYSSLTLLADWHPSLPTPSAFP